MVAQSIKYQVACTEPSSFISFFISKYLFISIINIVRLNRVLELYMIRNLDDIFRIMASNWLFCCIISHYSMSLWKLFPVFLYCTHFQPVIRVLSLLTQLVLVVVSSIIREVGFSSGTCCLGLTIHLVNSIT